MHAQVYMYVASYSYLFSWRGSVYIATNHLILNQRLAHDLAGEDVRSYGYSCVRMLIEHS